MLPYSSARLSPVWQLGAAPSLSVQALGLPQVYHLFVLPSSCAAFPSGFLKSLFPLPLPPQKRVQERDADSAEPRATVNTLFTNLVRGACCPAERLLRSPAYPVAQLTARV